MTEEQMLDYFQKEGIPHEQRGGKLFVRDASTLPGAYRSYFNDEGFFVDAGKKGVEREVKETIRAEGLGTEPPKPGPEGGAEATASAEAADEAEARAETRATSSKTRPAAKTAQKSALAKKAGSKK